MTSTSRELRRKNWTRIIFAKMKKLAINSDDTGEHDDSPIFPPELQEMILERVKDEPTLWRCRLVNSHWNQIGNSILEKHRLESWTNWQPLPRTLTFSPSANAWKPEQEYCLWLPQKLRLLSNNNNPFPSKSLTISRAKLTEGLNSKLLTINELLSLYGTYLTSLTLHKLKLSLSELESILCHLPSLKALTFSHIRSPSSSSSSGSPRSDPNKFTASFPNLTHVQLMYCSEEHGNWLLKLCGHQLISLEVEANGAIGYCVVPPLCKSRFEKLKYLKLYYTDKNGIEISKLAKGIRDKAPANLQYLSIYIMDLGLRGFEQAADLESLMGFVNRFSSSLKYLYLDVRLSHVGKQCSETMINLLEHAEIFPLLKQMTIVGLRGWEEGHFKNVVEHAYPNLQAIRFRSASKTNEE